MESGNPFFNQHRLERATEQAIDQEVMSLQGTMNKLGLLFLVLLVGASLTWTTPVWGEASMSMLGLIVGGLGGLLLSLVTVFRPQSARYTAVPYAFCEGLLLGGISSVFEAAYGGIVAMAVVITLGLFAGMYITYKARLFRVTQRFRNGVIGATIGVGLLYFSSIVLGFFGMSIPFLHSAGPVGIVINVVIIGIAMMNLVLDFDMVERMEEGGFPKFMEWYGAFSLMVTIVWLYMEILRLLARSRR